jgi:hypothetical protein
MTPSTIVWGTSQNRHVMRQVVAAACDASQVVSYRKVAKQHADASGKAKWLAATTVGNKKQKIGKELEQKQNPLVQSEEIPEKRHGISRTAQGVLAIALLRRGTKTKNKTNNSPNHRS